MRAWGVTLDVQFAIQKNCPDVGRSHEIGEIGISAAQFFHVAFELVVHGAQFFVDRLQFLFARLQFFGGGTHFLVHRLQLFIGSLQFFIGGLVLLDRGVEVLLEKLNFLIGVAHERLGRNRRGGRGWRFTLFLKQHQEKALRLIPALHRTHFNGNELGLAADLNSLRRAHCWLMLLLCSEQAHA